MNLILVKNEIQELSAASIEAEVNHGRGLVMYLLSQGAWGKVLSPQGLVDEIQSELDKMQSLYKCSEK